MVIFLLLCFPTMLLADDKQSLEQAANDPTASIMSIQLQNLYTGDYHQLSNETGNTISLRTSIPHDFGGLKHIARATLPVITNSPSGERGIGDLVVFDMVVTGKSWGRYGLGAVVLAPTASEDELGAGKWAIGPSMGFVVSADNWLMGIFNQNLFSFAGDDDRKDVNVSIFQPILNRKLPDGWSIGLSEMTVAYDWENSEFSALPLGFKVSNLRKIGHIPVQFTGSYEYNFADDNITPEWSMSFAAKFILSI